MLLPGLAAGASSCGDPATPISQVQGRTGQSPMAGQTVTVEGIVTHDARVPGGFQGFYLQQADHQTDDDPLSSEAVFVYTRRRSGRVGERLRVTGKVKEYHGLTELVGVKALTLCGREPLPEPAPLALPWSALPESLENMRVRFEHPLTVIDSHHLGQYGELTLAPTDQVKATEYQAPGLAAVRVADRNRQQRVMLDDGRRLKNPRPLPWPPGGLQWDQTIRAGDQVDELAGILDFRFGDWRLQPESPPVFVPTNPRQPPPARPAQPHIRVMTLNLANYFNGDGRGQGFPTPRGAESMARYQTQHQRLVTALRAPDADILALAELENDGYGPNSSIAALADALGPAWRFVATPNADGRDEIRTALLYRKDRVQPSGPPERLNTGPFRHHGRPPLSQMFRARDGEALVRIVTVHLKSKSCRGATGPDLDQNDGEGCFGHRRVRSATAILDWLPALPTPATLSGTLITGDLNAYARETPLAVFQAAGFASTVHRAQPCGPDACPHYTYRYKGEKGTLDYALASDALQPRVLTAATWLLNADEPRALGYEFVPDTGQALPWRSSDHNPVITDIQL